MIKERIITAGEGVRTPETARVGAVTFGAARLALGIYNDRAIDRSIPLKERVAQATPAILPHDAIATVSQDERRGTGVSNDDFAKGLIAFKAKLGEREAMLRAPHIGGKGWTKEEEAALEPITDAVILMYHLGVTGNTLEEATRNINTNIRERYLGKQTDIKQLVEDVVKKYKEWSGPSWQDSLSRILDSEYTFLFFHAFGGKDTATLILDDIRARMLLDADNQTGRAELNNTASQQDFFKPLEGDDKDAFAHLAKTTGQDKPEVKAQTPAQPRKDGATPALPIEQAAEQPAVSRRRTEAPLTTPQPTEVQSTNMMQPFVEPLAEAVPIVSSNESLNSSLSEQEEPSAPPSSMVEPLPIILTEVPAKEQTKDEEEKKQEKEAPVTWQVGVTEDEGPPEWEGGRGYMEDRHVTLPAFAGKPDHALFAVLDGHLGTYVADFAQTAIPTHLEAELKQAIDPEVALKKAIIATQGEIEKKKIITGSTAVVAFIKDKTLYVANLGDSRATLIHSNNTAEQLTTDHSLETFEERAKAGMIVNIGDKDHPRPISLNMYKALGDIIFPRMSHDPDISKRELTPADKWLLLTCDGVWERGKVLTMQEATHLIKDIEDPQKASEILTDAARHPEKYGLTNPDGTPRYPSSDNLTVIAVNLSQIVGLQEQRQ